MIRTARGCLALGLALASTACAADYLALTCPDSLPDVRIAGTEPEGRWVATSDGLAGDVLEGDDLREIWRRAGLREDEHLALPIHGALGQTGVLAIPDFQLAEVVGLDLDGSWRGPLMARGQGPGELTRPVLAAWDTTPVLHVVDLEGGKVERWAPAPGPHGTSLGGERVAVQLLAPMFQSGVLGWVGLQPGRALLVLDEELDPAAGVFDRTLRRQSLSLDEGPEGGAVDTLLTLQAPAADRDPAPGWPRGAQAVAADGRIAYADPGGSFAVAVLGPELDPLFRICRDVPPLPVTAEERIGGLDAEALADWPEEMARATMQAMREAPLPPRPAAIGRLVFDAEGRLWIQRERLEAFSMDLHWGTPGAEHLVFDVDGSFLGVVRLPPRARFQSALGDTVITFQEGDLDEVWIVAYEVQR